MAYKYYAVHRGRKPGIYRTWKECEKQIKGFSNPVFKGFDDFDKAIEFWKTGRVVGELAEPEPPKPEPSASVTIRQAGREAELPLEGAVEEALRQLGLIPLPE